MAAFDGEMYSEPVTITIYIEAKNKLELITNKHLFVKRGMNKTITQEILNVQPSKSTTDSEVTFTVLNGLNAL